MPNYISGSRGRPRDPGLEDRVLVAAIALYARSGWAGFTFEAVSRESGAGKNALRLRWPAKGDLLSAALQAKWYAIAEIDTGSLRGDLLVLAQAWFDALTGPYGGAGLHLYADSALFTEFRSAINPYGEPTRHQARLLVHRWIGQGDLPAATRASFVLDLLVGAVTNHIVAAPAGSRERIIEGRDIFVRELVEAVIMGVGAKLAQT